MTDDLDRMIDALGEPGQPVRHAAEAVLIEDMGAEEYQADRTAISASMMGELAKTPLHFWYRYLRPNAEKPKTTPALLLGAAVHMAVLEPERFAEFYSVAPEGDRRYAGPKAAYQEYLKGLEVTGATEISAADHATAMAVAGLARSHPMGKRLLCGGGKAEASVFWTDAETGVRCRMRPDFVPTTDAVIVDLKSTRCAAEPAFERDVWNYRYHVSAAFYREGWKALTGERRDYVWACWETEPPNACAFYSASAELLEHGRAEVRKRLRQYADCMAANEWPGYFPQIVELLPPSWVRGPK